MKTIWKILIPVVLILSLALALVSCTNTPKEDDSWMKGDITGESEKQAHMNNNDDNSGALAKSDENPTELPFLPLG